MAGDLDLDRISGLAKRLHLVLDPRRQRLGIGARMGAGAGNSLEFHDYRDYLAGDDPRMIDWGVFARSGQLLLRRHRQEIAPRLEIILDRSLSMGIDAAKWRLARQCCALLLAVARRDGSRPRCWTCADRFEAQQQPDERFLDDLGCAGAAGLAAHPPELSPGGERILISDGLHPAGGPAILRALARGAGSIALILILSRRERDPASDPALAGAVRLDDVEGGANDLHIDDTLREQYRRRLERHLGGWREGLAGRGAGLIDCPAESGLDGALAAMLRQQVLIMEGT